jgi:hypothetical protein
MMNKRLSEAITRIGELSDERQEAAATLLFEFLDQSKDDTDLTPEHIAEIERRLDEEDISTDEEVEALFSRAKK